MEVWLGILIGVALTVALIAMLGRRATRGADPTQLTFDSSVMGEVQQLAVSGRKIDAIKLLRDSNPTLSLAAAKAIVDKMAAPKPGTTVAGTAPPASSIPAVDAAMPIAAFDDSVPSVDTLALEVELQVRNLKAQGQTIPAIKLIREHTGWGLKEAKDYVDRLN